MGYHPLVGNGFCNDETNILECNYDGGDCCGSCIITDYCTNCTCIGNVISNGVPNSLVGDGFCNDETNIAVCNFDGGDCCVSCVKTDQCSNCSCHEGGTPTVDLSCKWSSQHTQHF